MIGRSAAAVLVAAALLAGTASAAWPCGNAVELSKSAAAKHLTRAEAALEAGRFRDVFDELDEMRYNFPATMRRKRTMVLATAMVRSGKDVAPRPRTAGSGPPPPPPPYVPNGVKNGLDLLEKLRDAGEDPVLTARLAEAYARIPERHGDAARLIEGLAAADLIPDAHGYVTLAVVRSRASDKAGAEAALDRCRQVAKPAQRDALCRLPAR